jgi:hypothetical protein
MIGHFAVLPKDDLNFQQTHQKTVVKYWYIGTGNMGNLAEF